MLITFVGVYLLLAIASVAAKSPLLLWVWIVPALLGLLLERTLYVHMYSRGHLDQVLFSIGLVFIAVGVGSDIWPHGRWRVDLPGEANHAGTTRLDDRRDALLELARVIQGARESASRRGCLATIGKVHVEPGGINAVACHATGWLDARGSNPEAVRGVIADVTAMVTRAHGEVREESWTPVTTFDPALASRLAGALGGIPLLGTGAGHDAGVLTQAGIPSAMLFVRNPTGVSHSPAEFADPADCEAGIDALVGVVTELCGGTS